MYQKGITWFGVPGATDIWQPVDGGYGATLKVLINQQLFDWLDDDEATLLPVKKKF